MNITITDDHGNKKVFTLANMLDYPWGGDIQEEFHPCGHCGQVILTDIYLQKSNKDSETCEYCINT